MKGKVVKCVIELFLKVKMEIYLLGLKDEKLVLSEFVSWDWEKWIIEELIWFGFVVVVKFNNVNVFFKVWKLFNKII